MASEFFVLHHDDILELEVVEGRMETLNRVKEVLGDFNESSKKNAGRFLEGDKSLMDQGPHYLKSFTLRNVKGKFTHVYETTKK